MRIGFLLDGFTGGGIGRAVSVLGNSLCERPSYEVFALAYSQNGEPDIYSPAFPVKYIYPRLVSMRRAILKEHYLSEVISFVRENDISVLVAAGVQFYPIATFVARKCKIRSVCWEHTNPYQNGDFLFEDLSRRLGAKTSDCNIVLTEECLDVYNKRFPRSKNVHIFNAIDPELFGRENKLDCDSKRIISVGRLSEPKDFPRLMRIARAVFDRVPDWGWDIYGEGPMRPQLESLISELELEDKVILKGQVSDIYSRYGDYAFMVMTSKYEGFPMTLLEGAACALPLVAFDISTGPKEIIRNGENGFICDPASDDGMIERICQLISDARLRESMSEKSREMISDFASDIISEKWAEVLSVICNDQR